MSPDPQPQSLIEQLDQMQDEVLDELDKLDEKILGLIQQCTSGARHGLTVVRDDEELPEAA